MQNENEDLANSIQDLANKLDNDSLEEMLSALSKEIKDDSKDERGIVSQSMSFETKVGKETNMKLPERTMTQTSNFIKNNTIEGHEKEIDKLINPNKEELSKEIKEKKEELKSNIVKVENEEKSIIESNNNEFIETYTESDTLNAMKLIASNPNYSESLLQYTDPKVSENQFKLFLIAQCKREMYKVLDYSDMLDKLEERFKTVYINRLEELPDGMIIRLMQLVLDKIDRANALINSVIKDKEITNVLVINQQNNTVNKISDLTKDELLKTLYRASQEKAESPSASRAKVVEVVTDVLKDMADNEKYQEQENEQVSTEEQLENIIKVEELKPTEQLSDEELKRQEIDKALARLQQLKNNEEGGN